MFGLNKYIGKSVITKKTAWWLFKVSRYSIFTFARI